MPFKLLFTSAIEKVLNIFLYHTSALKSARQRLNGKVLVFTLKEFPTSLTLVFSERQLNVLGQWEGEANCSVIINMSALLKLCDCQQLTLLIRNDDLKIDGDIQVLKNLLALIDLAEFDLAELLAPYIGDILAEGSSKALCVSMAFVRKQIQHQKRYIADLITEEWSIAPGSLEVAWFSEETVAIDRTVEALSKRLEKLEKE